LPIHFAVEPKNGAELVRKGLNRISERRRPLSAQAVDFNALQVTQPHSIYDLRADAVASGGGLASATESSIRYLVHSRGATIAAAEVLVDATGTATILTNINYGPFVEATVRAFARVKTLEAVEAASYEMRLLRFAAIGLMALWLRPDSEGANIIYPISPAPDGLQSEHPYSAEEFFKIVLPLALKRSAETDPGMVP